MTVKEHLIFFGNLKGLMSAEEVEEDVEKYSCFLFLKCFSKTSIYNNDIYARVSYSWTVRFRVVIIKMSIQNSSTFIFYS